MSRIQSRAAKWHLTEEGVIVRTGRVHVCRKIPYNGQLLSVYRQAILVREGDRFSVYDPSAENELMRGCTAAFIQYLLDKEFLIYVEKAS